MMDQVIEFARSINLTAAIASAAMATAFMIAVWQRNTAISELRMVRRASAKLLSGIADNFAEHDGLVDRPEYLGSVRKILLATSGRDRLRLQNIADEVDAEDAAFFYFNRIADRYFEDKERRLADAARHFTPWRFLPEVESEEAHASDCATHNAPAMEPEPCDCEPVGAVTESGGVDFLKP